jgi:predicted transposase YbfD/YdcC
MTSYNKRKNTEESRYFISSLTTSAVKMAGYIKSHWGIENDLHWYLDVVFKEDARIIWNKNFAKNEGIVRRLALHSVKKIQSLAAIKLNLKHVAAKNLRKILMGDDELFERAINDAFN